MLNRIGFRLQKWFAHRFKVGVYGRRNDEIIVWRGLRKPDRIQIEEIESWQMFPDMTFDIVEINLKNGYRWQLLDIYNDLIAILREAARNRERVEKTNP